MSGNVCAISGGMAEKKGVRPRASRTGFGYYIAFWLIYQTYEVAQGADIGRLSSRCWGFDFLVAANVVEIAFLFVVCQAAVLELER